MQVRRALISVYDKRGVAEFARGLVEMGVEIVSTGKTAVEISSAGVPVTPIDRVTGFPEMLDGRVKTLHPAIHAGILADRTRPDHMAALEEHGIVPIGLVVSNLYPFRETVAREDVTVAEAMDNVDIGGPAMIRAAAKNWASVGVVVDPDDYPEVLLALEENDGELPDDLRLQLATKAFTHTAAYDAAISAFFQSMGEGVPPETLVLEFYRTKQLRYGENPHQKGAFYASANPPKGTVASARQLSGRDLSFTNILDLDAALELVKDFDKPAAAIIKHTNPCGVATAETLVEAFISAREADNISRFGGIIAVNRRLDAETAREITRMGGVYESVLTVVRPGLPAIEVPVVSRGSYYEAIIAPSYSKEALELLQQRKYWGQTIRIMECGPLPGKKERRQRRQWDVRSVAGGLLLQEPDFGEITRRDLKVVTERAPTDEEIEAMLFAWKVVKRVKSNAAVLARGDLHTGGRGFRAVGIGTGQQNRADPVAAAVQRAGALAEGSVLASEAFFPKPDGPEIAAKAGVTAIIQTGGSNEDEKVIEVANRYGMAMVFTGMRHFRH